MIRVPSPHGRLHQWEFYTVDELVDARFYLLRAWARQSFEQLRYDVERLLLWTS